jgi:hypothetical protein
MSRRHAKRTSRGGRFARLPLSVLKTPAVTTLSHAEFRVLVLLAAQYTGYNNGDLGITRSQAAEQGIGSDHTLYGALRNLEARGLIDQTYRASRVPPRPAKYAISWESVDDTEWSSSVRLPTHAYRDWQAPPKKARRRRPRLTVVGGEQ